MGGLSTLFSPASVAVVGATDRPGSVGRSLVTNVRDSFDGEVVPINPNRETLLDMECFPNLHAAPPVDLAVVALAPEATVEAVEQAGEAGVENVIVVSAGFSEVGSDGTALERTLVASAERHDLTLVGPNCLGVMSTSPSLNATFGPDLAEPGSISFLSQSGAFITAVIDWARERGVGFKDVVSLGNAAVLDQTDFIRHWGDDPETDAIVGYLEGIDDGRAFIEVCREVTTHTPIILVKAGRTEAGAQAASSHTGAMAGSEEAYAAGLEQAGVIRAETFEELFDAAQSLTRQPIPDGDDVAVVTNAGGPGVMATDAVNDAGLSLASFEDGTRARFDDVLPDTASYHNPVDVLGDADVERFRETIALARADENVDAVAVVSAPTAVLSFAELGEAIADEHAAGTVPVVACLMGGRRVREAVESLRERGVPTYADPSRAVHSLGALSTYREISKRRPESPSDFDVDRDRARAVLEQARDRKVPRLGVEALDLLEAYGVPTPRGRVADSPGSATDVAASFDGPAALKLVSPDIQHKTDIGAVILDVETEDVPRAYETIVTRARNYQPDATILGILVQEQLDLEDATEVIVGCTRDPQFGPVILFGLGGIFVEAIEDTTVRVGPISRREAESMIDDVQASPLLRGARGRPAADVDAVVETLERIAQLASDFPAILELDVNPLIAGPDGVSAIDLRLTVDTDTL